MSESLEIQEFEKGVTRLSFILKGNLDNLQRVRMQLEEIQLNKSHSNDFSEIGFLMVSGVIGFVALIDIIQEFGRKVAWITIILFSGLLFSAYKMTFVKQKSELIDKINSYIDSKNTVLGNTKELFIELQKYTQTKSINPTQVENISQQILSYAKNMREIYKDYHEISTQDTTNLAEYRGYKKHIKSFFQYEKNAFQEIIDGFNMIFDFWIQTHISKMQSYQSQIEKITLNNKDQENALLLAVTQMDTNIKMFEKIQLLKN